MFDFPLWFSTFGTVVGLGPLTAAVAGTLIGFVVGALPGLGTVATVSLLLPLTFEMQVGSAIIMFLAIYAGAQAGNSFSAILIGTPGTPGAAATVEDGFAMSNRGEAARALGLSMWASFTGNLISIVLFICFAPLLSQLSVKFGPAEYFWLGILGITSVACFTERSLTRGLVSAAFGVFLATIGMDPISGTFRFTFGNPNLYSGLSVIAVLIGLYAVSQCFLMATHSSERLRSGSRQMNMRWGQAFGAFREIATAKWLAFKASLLGAVIGILPGAGTDIAAWMAYSNARSASRHRSEFGRGTPEGIIAPECANNAVTGGSMIPLLTLGIPGSPTAAVILAGLMIHGLVPGRTLFTTQVDFTYLVMAGFVVASIMMLVIGIVGARYCGNILRIPQGLIVVCVFVLCVVGVYSVNNSTFDVLVATILGVVGFVMRKNGFHPAAAVLGFILAPIVEKSLRQAMIISGDSLSYLFTSYISMIIIAIIAASLLARPVSEFVKFRRGAVERAE